MGITDFFTDVWETFAHPSPDAEVQGGTSTKTPASGTDEESSEEAEVNKQDAKSGGDSGEQGYKPSSKPSDEDDEPEEEEEDEEEPDPKEKLEKGESNLDAQFRGVTGSNEVPSFWVESMHWTGL
jgi:ubiquinol-cytochrome c reductase subunit 6